MKGGVKLKHKKGHAQNASFAGFKRSVAGVWRKSRLERTTIGTKRAADVESSTEPRDRRPSRCRLDGVEATQPGA